MATPRGEAVQTPASVPSKRGLGREVRAALFRVNTWPECAKGNLRELEMANQALRLLTQ